MCACSSIIKYIVKRCDNIMRFPKSYCELFVLLLYSMLYLCIMCVSECRYIFVCNSLAICIYIHVCLVLQISLAVVVFYGNLEEVELQALSANVLSIIVATKMCAGF